jgi:hypothetical protein
MEDKCELFVLEAPREIAENIAHLINYLSTRKYKTNETVESHDLRMVLHSVDDIRKEQLLKTHLTAVNPAADLLQLKFDLTHNFTFSMLKAAGSTLIIK